MKCPKCSSEIGRSEECSKCNTDISLYKKIKGIAYRLYNKGLEQANGNDLTGAITSLQKSIEFDKTNMQARNLLGLVFYEIGHIGEALKHWVISTSFQKEENPAKEYIDKVQSSGRKLERYNDAIKMYNQGLQYAAQKSEDMAIIQLKKVIDINPNFVDAYCLLALCYMAQEQSDKALVQVEKALAIDVNNPIAVRYYKELNPGGVRPTAKEKPAPVVQQPRYSRTMHMEQKRRNSFSPVWEIVSFLLGAACTAAVLYILVFPAQIDVKDNMIKELEESNAGLQTKIETITAENKEIVDNLEKQNEELRQSNDQLAIEQEVLAKNQRVQQAAILTQDNKLEEAGVILKSLDPYQVPADMKETYDALVAQVYPKIAEQSYRQGSNHFWSKKYDEAEVQLEKSRQFSETGYFADEVVYLLARTYEEKKDPAKAKMMYQQLIEQYPSSKRVSISRSRVQALE